MPLPPYLAEATKQQARNVFLTPAAQSSPCSTYNQGHALLSGHSPKPKRRTALVSTEAGLVSELAVPLFVREFFRGMIEVNHGQRS